MAAGWNGGNSLEFDERLDELEHEHHGRLTASERVGLWDEALTRR